MSHCILAISSDQHSHTANRPLKNCRLKIRYPSSTEKSQQAGMIDHSLLKGWSAHKIQKELAETVGADAYSHPQVSRWLTRFSTGEISCLDEPRTSRSLSNFGPPLERFSAKFPFATARIIAMHFNVSHTTVKDMISRELWLQKLSRRWMRHQFSEAQNSCALILRENCLPCSVKISSSSLIVCGER
jgi:hypothetical protein